MPELLPYVRLLYGGPTSFFVAGSDGNERVISSRGATQGCAFGSLLHCLVSREPLMQYVTEIRKLDPDAMVLSIIDDVETVCDGDKVPLAKATDLLNNFTDNETMAPPFPANADPASMSIPAAVCQNTLQKAVDGLIKNEL